MRATFPLRMHSLLTAITDELGTRRLPEPVLTAGREAVSEPRLEVLPDRVLLGAMNITVKGQVTIPLRIRNRFGLKPGTAVEFVVVGNQVTIRPRRKGTSSAEAWLSQATGAVKGRTTAQIMHQSRGED